MNVTNTELNDVFMLVIAGVQFLEEWKNHKICAVTKLELLADLAAAQPQRRGVITLLESTYFPGCKAV